MSWWVSSLIDAGMVVELVSWIFWVLLSITLHELAHGWAALWQGDDTPVQLHRMTANPIVHMGPQSLIMFAICGIAWGQMPVNPSRFRDGRRGDVYVSAAGPLMNIALAMLCLISLVAWIRLGPEGSEWYGNGAAFLFQGLALNLILAPLNLLPIPPLDGSHILAGLSYRAANLFNQPNAQIFGLMVFIAIFFMTPVGDLLFGAAWRGAALLVDLLGVPLGNPSLAEVQFGRAYS